ncbi:hypothetical protein MMMB2_2393 [Mycobacterium marinum MB2]|nr:hypothetical protein MMMB2_2393 [Mycobacterium marinum MB2]
MARHVAAKAAPSNHAKRFGRVGFHTGRVPIVNAVPRIPVGLNGVSPVAAAANMSKSTNGPTMITGSVSGRSKSNAMVIAEMMFSKPARARVATSLMRGSACPCVICPIAHHGVLRKACSSGTRRLTIN